MDQILAQLRKPALPASIDQLHRELPRRERFHLIGMDQAIERVQDGTDSLNRIGSRINANYRISTSVEEPFEGR